MAENLPINFAIPGENLIASYDWYQTLSDIGYQNFYLMKIKSTTATSYILTNQLTYADRYCIEETTSDKDFDLTVLKPCTLKGDLIVLLSFRCPSGTPVITGTLYHVNGAGTETSLGSGTISAEAVGEAYNHMRLLKFTLTEKSFGIGEKIRLNLTWSSVTHIYLDPSNRNEIKEGPVSSGSALMQSTQVFIPFKVEL